MKSPKIRRVLVCTGRKVSQGGEILVHVTDAAIAGDARLKKQQNQDIKNCVVLW